MQVTYGCYIVCAVIRYLKLNQYYLWGFYYGWSCLEDNYQVQRQQSLFVTSFLLGF